MADRVSEFLVASRSVNLDSLLPAISNQHKNKEKDRNINNSNNNGLQFNTNVTYADPTSDYYLGYQSMRDSDQQANMALPYSKKKNLVVGR